jgi:SAP domain-containing ribonucleoprotein
LPVVHESTAEPVSAADVEIEKRKARAAKFGVPYVEVPAPASKTPKTKPSALLNGGTKASARAVSSTVPAEDAEVLAKRRAKFGVSPLPSKGRTSADGLATSTPSAQTARLIDP